MVRGIAAGALVAACCLAGQGDYGAFAADGDLPSVKYLSHAPIHPVQPPSARPMASGPAYFVNPTKGDDANPGTENAPWRTINYALKQIKAGDTLCLRGGIYHEDVYCAIAGKPDAPVTIRSYPGEQATIDGGMPEFLESPDKAWEPDPNGAPDEYRSVKAYKNLRDVLGLFGDSNIGLQTYWYGMDLRATNENNIPDPDKKIMVLPQGQRALWVDWAGAARGLVGESFRVTYLQHERILDALDRRSRCG